MPPRALSWMGCLLQEKAWTQASGTWLNPLETPELSPAAPAPQEAAPGPVAAQGQRAQGGSVRRARGCPARPARARLLPPARQQQRHWPRLGQSGPPEGACQCQPAGPRALGRKKGEVGCGQPGEGLGLCGAGVLRHGAAWGSRDTPAPTGPARAQFASPGPECSAQGQPRNQGQRGSAAARESPAPVSPEPQCRRLGWDEV